MSSGEINKKRLRDTDNKISQIGYDNSNARWVKNNSVLIALAGQGKTRGTVAINEIPLTTNQSIAAIEPNNKLISEFLFHNLDRRYEELRLVSSGAGTRGGLNKKLISEIEIMTPSIHEQIQVGQFFKKLDNTIALHQEKLSKLNALKEAYLQQMFPQYKENNPKVRFTNFGEKWQKSKLSEVLNVNSGRDYKHLKSGDVPVYGTGGYMLSVDQCLSDEDAIGIGRKGTIDKPQYLKSPFWTVDTLFYMKVKKGYDLLFVYSISQTVRWKKYDESTGVPSLSKTTINNITKTFPPYKEQVAIGKFFDKINELIDLEQIKLDKLKNLKKAYLRKMFI